MAPIHFLNLPTLVRDQIYTELVVPPIIKLEDGSATQEPPCLNILYTNRQIYTEASDIFYSQNLLTVVSTNCPIFLGFLHEDDIPVLCRIKDPAKLAQCHRFAMTMEMLELKNQHSATGTPALVLSSQALPYFVSLLIGKTRHVTSTGGVRMKIEQTFRYSTYRLSKKLFGPILKLDAFPKVGALRFEGPVDPSHELAMVQKLVNDGPSTCQDFASQARTFCRRLSSQIDTQVRDWPQAQIVELSKLIIRQCDWFWDCRAYTQKQTGHKCVVNRKLFWRTASAYDTLVCGHLIAADGCLEDGAEHHVRALRAAEEGIAYLNRKDRIQYPSHPKDNSGTHSNDDNLTQAAKGTLSWRASQACKMLGYPIEAEAYVEDARLYKAEPPSDSGDGADRLDHDWPPVPDVAIEVVLWKKEGDAQL